MTPPVPRIGSGPVASMLPYELWDVLAAAGVKAEVVGSVATGGPAHDLDLVVDPSPANLARLERALAPLAFGNWRRMLRRLAEGDGPGPYRVVTSLGWLDLLGERPR